MIQLSNSGVSNKPFTWVLGLSKRGNAKTVKWMREERQRKRANLNLSTGNHREMGTKGRGNTVLNFFLLLVSNAHKN